MKFGSPFSAGFGSPENWLAEFSCEAQDDKIRVYFMPAEDGYYGIYRDSELQYMLLVVQSQQVVQWVTADTQVDKQIVSVIRTGQVGVNVKRAARWYDAQTSLRSTIEWHYDYEIMGSVDPTTGLTQLSNWVLTGIDWSLLSSVNGSLCRGYLEVNINATATSDDVVISLSRAGYLLAQGTLTFGGTDGVVTLVEQNDSGVSGTVNVANEVVDGTEYLYIRYPKSMQIIRGLSDPPTTVIKTVPFLGDEDANYTETSDLAPNTNYYYRTRPVSDTGELGAVSATTTIVCAGPPEPPGTPAYVSGDAADCTIDWVESTTVGVTYNVYIQGPTDSFINLNDPVAVTANSYGYQLPVMAFPGTSFVIVRAVIGGVEEENRNILRLEFDDAGAFVPARPNTPTITSATATNGLTISVKACYDPAREVGVATKVNLYIKVPGGVYTITSPDGTAALVNDGGVKSATVTAVAPFSGWYWCKLTASTAIDVEDSTGDEAMVYVSDTVNAAVLIDGVPTRG
jgi:hypothetical protein